MEIKLTTKEKKMLREINKYSYQLEISDRLGERGISQEKNISRLLKAMSIFAEYLKEEYNISENSELSEIENKLKSR